MDRWINVPFEEKHGHLVPFVSGGVYFETDAKEPVMVTNGSCILAHDNPEAFAAAHVGTGCIYSPSEAWAIRFVGVTKTGDPIIAGTYRAVRAEALHIIVDPTTDESIFGLAKLVRKSRYAGRV